MSFYGRRTYVPVAQRRQRAAKKIAAMRKAGKEVSPVQIEGRKITRTFWGDSWCENLEAYSDFANRLPRGRTYVRNGSVIDLKIEAGRVQALVSGTGIYSVDVRIEALASQRWDAIKEACAGKIDSVVELLRGKISRSVMEVVTRPGEGLFPSPDEISVSCSCPDWAVICKHVAAALYGVGARLDDEPEKLFTLRKADPAELIAAAVAQGSTRGKSARGRVLESSDISSVFGIDLDAGPEAPAAPKTTRRKKATAKKATAKKATAKKATAKKATAKKATATSPTKGLETGKPSPGAS